MVLNTDAVFDVQVKRLHEYKRQLLNVLHIIHLYNQLRDNPNMEFTPQTFLFGAKAAPATTWPRRSSSSSTPCPPRSTPTPSAKISFRWSFWRTTGSPWREKLMPASEISEQISTAGKEASGTGNMKFMMNGALTIGTLDGANVEMHQQLGDENIFLFGLTADQVVQLKNQGYIPANYYNSNPAIKRVLDQIRAGFGDGVDYNDIADRLLVGAGGSPADEYLLLADFDSYCQAHRRPSRPTPTASSGIRCLSSTSPVPASSPPTGLSGTMPAISGMCPPVCNTKARRTPCGGPSFPLRFHGGGFPLQICSAARGGWSRPLAK